MNDTELLHYSRQILLPEIGIEGQQRLLNAKILIIGLGGLGSPAAMYLAAAGVGHLYISDFDKVEQSNLQRQIIHNTNNIGKYKVDSARESLLALNPSITVTPLYKQLDHQALIEPVNKVDIVLDCTDNLKSRLAINQACVQTKTPLISGAAIRMEGQISVFNSNLENTPCYRCLYPNNQEIVETCTETGILAPMVGIIGSLQALEAMKVIIGIGNNLIGQLLLIDGITMDFQTIKVKKNPKCPTCT
ncbi:HesA/MoeB/ThiF family protein [Candidatus Marithrix sp. Canyon 246]|uniref:HesA/MoeB/ThiF family protein n=1 Tax=Candidatus Marithrix sp. Canyon 246 TaxID=1827136 RepID=UPI000849FA1B|nr:molybdopterin-synthase adenylyltransferase MoeB [Candidatus Marithrix sp. Canyon 246]